MALEKNHPDKTEVIASRVFKILKITSPVIGKYYRDDRKRSLWIAPLNDIGLLIRQLALLPKEIKGKKYQI